MDVKTRYMQLAYPIEFLKKFRYEDGKELAEAYDKIMEQQYTFNGSDDQKWEVEDAGEGYIKFVSQSEMSW